MEDKERTLVLKASINNLLRRLSMRRRYEI